MNLGNRPRVIGREVVIAGGGNQYLYFGPYDPDEVVEGFFLDVTDTAPSGNVILYGFIRCFEREPLASGADFPSGLSFLGQGSTASGDFRAEITGVPLVRYYPLNWRVGSPTGYRWLGFRLNGQSIGGQGIGSLFVDLKNFG